MIFRWYKVGRNININVEMVNSINRLKVKSRRFEIFEEKIF